MRGRGAVLAAVAVALLVILAVWWLATRPPSDMPTAAGRYPVRSGSIVHDGAAYGFLWAGRDGAFTRARSSAVRLVLDETTFLEVAPPAPPELHVAQDEAIRTERPTATPRPPVIVRRDDGRDDRRDDAADDAERETRPAPTRRALTPSATPGLAPVDDGVSGQNRGAGGGNAITNKTASRRCWPPRCCACISVRAGSSSIGCARARPRSTPASRTRSAPPCPASRTPPTHAGASRNASTRIRSGGGGGALLPVLSAIANARNAVPDAKIEGINFREGTVDLRIIAPSAASFDAIGQQLRAATWDADIKEIGASGESYRGRLQVRKAGA